MGRGRNTGNLIVTAHVYIYVSLELDLPTKHHHLVKLWENFLQLCHLGRAGLCLVWTCGGDSYGGVLAKEVLLFHRLGCYLVYWIIVDVGHWISQGSLHQSC